MLTIRIHNTGTGTNESANYDYWVYVNQREIAKGEIKGHNRDKGWVKLVGMIVEQEEAYDDKV